MAQAKSITFGKMFMLLQEQDSAGLYVAPCGFESLTMTVNVETNTTNVPDCNDPDLAAWLATDVVSQQMTLEGSGVLDTDAMQLWQDWWYNDGAAERNVRFFRDLDLSEGGGYFEGPGIITAFSETGTRGERWQISVTVTMNGKPTWVPQGT